MSEKSSIRLHVFAFLASLLLLSSCGTLSKSLYSSIFGHEPKGRKKIQKKEEVKITKLDKSINSESSETTPVVSADGQTLFFARSSGSNLFDFKIYEAQLIDGVFKAPVNMGNPPNIDDQNYIGSATSDKQSIAFSANPAVSSGSENIKIYIAKKRQGKWVITEELDFFPGKKGWGYNIFSGKFDVETHVNMHHPFITADGSKLFFSSNCVDGYGGNDLYVCEKGADGKWSSPRNLGPEINTKHLEFSPFLHPDNKTLYFISNGHPGIGKLDVYKSVLKDGKWSVPELIGEPISSPAVEISFTMDAKGEKAYFTSDRIKEADSDIYMTPVPKSAKPDLGAILLTGRVTDGLNNKPLEAEITIEDIKSGKVVARLQSDFNTGYYSVSLPRGTEYSVSVNKEGYTFHSINMDIGKESEQQGKEKNFELFSIKKGTKLVLNNIFFDTDSDKLKDESMLELDRAVRILEKNKDFSIEIGGHTDNVGSKSYNKNLSEKRAKSVKAYLVKKGIPGARLSCKGYGMAQPIVSNDTEEGRRQNRRVEFIFR